MLKARILEKRTKARTAANAEKKTTPTKMRKAESFLLLPTQNRRNGIKVEGVKSAAALSAF